MYETIANAYEVWEPPRAFYIDENGVAFGFTLGFAAKNATIKWIEDKNYKRSPLAFNAPARLN